MINEPTDSVIQYIVKLSAYQNLFSYNLPERGIQVSPLTGELQLSRSVSDADREPVGQHVLHHAIRDHHRVFRRKVELVHVTRRHSQIRTRGHAERVQWRSVVGEVGGSRCRWSRGKVGKRKRFDKTTIKERTMGRTVEVAFDCI